MDGLIATFSYVEYLRRRDQINNDWYRGLTTFSEWKERRFMLECEYWLGI